MKKFVITNNASMMCFDEQQNVTVRLFQGDNSIDVLNGDFTDPDLDIEIDMNTFYTELKRRLLIIQRTTNYHV